MQSRKNVTHHDFGVIHKQLLYSFFLGSAINVLFGQEDSQPLSRGSLHERKKRRIPLGWLLRFVSEVDKGLALVDERMIIDADNVSIGRSTHLTLEFAVGVHHGA